jgi:hypothetical protein
MLLPALTQVVAAFFFHGQEILKVHLNFRYLNITWKTPLSFVCRMFKFLKFKLIYSPKYSSDFAYLCIFEPWDTSLKSS